MDDFLEVFMAGWITGVLTLALYNGFRKLRGK